MKTDSARWTRKEKEGENEEQVAVTRFGAAGRRTQIGIPGEETLCVASTCGFRKMLDFFPPSVRILCITYPQTFCVLSPLLQTSHKKGPSLTPSLSQNLTQHKF